ncbi:glycosyltransferase [candidate division WWE3 bacterium]|uniref:Glycosyltransferase n=1 Tax=candidate division WWE3 bacterium TaxID=2053526 RepID=A0A955LKD8_UNCKA|nr:glycosyltransferase [candidate division WWE3 bacterium]
MNVGIFSDTYLPKIDGVAVSISDLIGRFDELGVEYDLYVPHVPNCSSRKNVYRFRSLPLIFQPEVRLSLTLDVRNLKRAYTRRYDVVHSHSPGPVGMLATQVALTRGVAHFHTVHTYLPDYTHYIFQGRILRPQAVNKVYAFWLNRINYLVAPSYKVKTWLEQIGVRSEIAVIPNGVKLSRFLKDDNGDYLLKNGFVNPGERVILTVGRVAEEKSIDTLINYFAGLLKERQDVVLVVVGDGPASGQLKEQTRRLGIHERVRFTGYINNEDMPKAYASADLFTTQSRSETQGLAVVEALASGLPVVIAQDPAYQGMVQEGENGFYSDSASEFVDSVAAILDDESMARVYGSKSKTLSREFDIATTTKMLVSFYERGLVSPVGKKRVNLPFSIAKLREELNKAYNELKNRIGKDV